MKLLMVAGVQVKPKEKSKNKLFRPGYIYFFRDAKDNNEEEENKL
jgi:hypothetical protein